LRTGTTISEQRFITKRCIPSSPTDVDDDDDDDDNNNNGCGIAQGARVPSPGQSGTRTGFLRVLRLPLPILIPQTAPYSLLTLSWTLYTYSDDTGENSGKIINFATTFMVRAQANLFTRYFFCKRGTGVVKITGALLVYGGKQNLLLLLEQAKNRNIFALLENGETPKLSSAVTRMRR
jgi:hypothetical protein